MNGQNPGLQADWHEGEDGLWRPTITADDPSAYERLLLRAAAGLP